MMPDLPERVPVGEYIAAGDALGCAPELVRALAQKESWESKEHPGDIRLEAGKWKLYRFASREAKAFDGQRNSAARERRWETFRQMDAVCQADAVLNARAGDAAILSHSFGWCQIMGFNHRFCDFESARDWLAAMATLKGQRECFIAFVRSNAELHRAFQARNYAVIGLHYNGAAYRRNNYDADVRKFDLALQKNGIAYA